jgi:hypothetical protein
MWQARIARLGLLVETGVIGFGVVWALWAVALG